MLSPKSSIRKCNYFAVRCIKKNHVALLHEQQIRLLSVMWWILFHPGLDFAVNLVFSVSTVLVFSVFHCLGAQCFHCLGAQCLSQYIVQHSMQVLHFSLWWLTAGGISPWTGCVCSATVWSLCRHVCCLLDRVRRRVVVTEVVRQLDKPLWQAFVLVYCKQVSSIMLAKNCDSRG